MSTGTTLGSSAARGRAKRSSALLVLVVLVLCSGCFTYRSPDSELTDTNLETIVKPRGTAVVFPFRQEVRREDQHSFFFSTPILVRGAEWRVD